MLVMSAGCRSVTGIRSATTSAAPHQAVIRARPQMRAEEDPDAAEPEVEGGRQARITVDARHASGVVVGEGSTQINYHYGSGPTWNDGVAAPPLVSVSGRVDSPYRGLNAFEEQDAAFFFGRETAATQILRLMSQRLEGAGLLVVSGASGVGKSSLLRAGVLPRLRGAGLGSAPGSAMWPCLAFTPARGPLEELAARVAALAGADAAAVRRGLDADPAGFALTARQAALSIAEEGWAGFAPEPRLLLVVDQFEQLFTQCGEEQQRRAFITALHAATTAGHGPYGLPAALAVLAVRADFEARCADYPELAAAVQDRYLLAPMSERQLRMAITEPAVKAGSRVEDELVRVLLDEAGNRASVLTSAGAGASAVSRAGVLPLLSHALDQAWRQRAGDALTLADYERAGGIEGAVAASAQRAYNGLTSTQQATARWVFTRLAAAGPDGVDLADRVSQAELTVGKNVEQASAVAAVLERFTAERLLTLAAGTVEISHEALLTAWPLLRDEWLAETRADRIARTRLRSIAADWAHHSRDPSYLYRGSLLEAAAAAAARITADPARHPPLSAGEQDFLDASSAWQAREQRKARRRVRRRYQLAALVSVLVVVALGVLAYARQVQVISRREHVQALSRQVANEAERMRGQDVPLSMQLALAAYQAAPTPEARSSLLDSTDMPAATRLANAEGNADSVAATDHGSLMAVGSDRGTVQLWRAAAGGLLGRLGRPLRGPAGPVISLAFSPSGSILAGAAQGDSRISLWDTADPAHPVSLGKFSGHGGAILSVAISPDGRTMAAASTDDKVYLWDMSDRAHPALLARLTGPTGPVTSVAFTPSGRILAAGSQDTRVYLWSTTHPARPVPLTPLHGPTSQVLSIAISPGGRYLAAGTRAQHNVYLWDIHDPARPAHAGRPLTGPASWVNSVAFSPDGRTLAAGSSDDQAWLFSRPASPPESRHQRRLPQPRLAGHRVHRRGQRNCPHMATPRPGHHRVKGQRLRRQLRRHRAQAGHQPEQPGTLAHRVEPRRHTAPGHARTSPGQRLRCQQLLRIGRADPRWRYVRGGLRGRQRVAVEYQRPRAPSPGWPAYQGKHPTGGIGHHQRQWPAAGG